MSATTVKNLLTSTVMIKPSFPNIMKDIDPVYDNVDLSHTVSMIRKYSTEENEGRLLGKDDPVGGRVVK